MKEEFFDARESKRGIGITGVIIIILIAALLGSGVTYWWLDSRGAFSAQAEIPVPTNAPAATVKPQDETEEAYAGNATVFTELYQKNCNAVVVIDTYITYEGELTHYGKSSGFITDTQGYILTNSHVVEEAESIKVTLFNGSVYDAQEIGHDERTEVAVLKIEPEEQLPDCGNGKFR